MKIDHIALYVHDLEAARRFFLKYLGASSNEGYCNPRTSFRSYFLSFDDGARLELMNRSDMADLPKDLSRTGYAHIAFSVAPSAVFDSATASATRRMRSVNVEIINFPITPPPRRMPSATSFAETTK